MLRPLLLFILAATLAGACGKGSSTAADQEPASSTSAAVNYDSLQQVYARRLSEWDSLPTQQVKESGRLYPVDEAPLDTAFFLFRADLLDAVRTHDVFALLDRVDKNIKVDFGGSEGVAAFVETWNLDSKTDTSELWNYLATTLQLGGTFSDNRQSFTAPYVFSTWPSGEEYDEALSAAITGSGVRVRSAPSLNSRILETISHEIVTLPEQTEDTIYETIAGETYPWVKIKTRKGNEGYVYGKFIRSPMDFRAGFRRDGDGGWKMTFFVAGD